MKNTIWTIALGLCLMISMPAMQAQNANKPHKNKEEKEAKINELRKKYFNDKLALTEAEQKAFWPLYDEYRQKEKALRDTFQKKYKSNEIVFMDDKKAEEYLNALVKLHEDQNALYKDYLGKFKKVLPIKKVAMIPTTEKAFKKEMMQKVGHLKKAPKKGQGPPPEE
ncbi:MAG: hypothetical protein V4613_05140 [Bacteroidota bacterium]